MQFDKEKQGGLSAPLIQNLQDPTSWVNILAQSKQCKYLNCNRSNYETQVYQTTLNERH